MKLLLAAVLGAVCVFAQVRDMRIVKTDLWKNRPGRCVVSLDHFDCLNCTPRLKVCAPGDVWADTGSAALVEAGGGIHSVQQVPQQGTGQVVLTNGSATITGIGTDFENGDPDGLNWTWEMWVKDSAGAWYFVSIDDITSNTDAVISEVYTDVYEGSQGVTWPGASGTYDYFLTRTRASGNLSTAVSSDTVTASGERALILGGSHVVASGSKATAIAAYGTTVTGTGAMAINTNAATLEGVQSMVLGNGADTGLGATGTIVIGLNSSGVDRVSVNIPNVFAVTGGMLLLGNYAEPTCDAAHRGSIAYGHSTAGVADTVRICRKNASDAYEWVSLL